MKTSTTLTLKQSTRDALDIALQDMNLFVALSSADRYMVEFTRVKDAWSSAIYNHLKPQVSRYLLDSRDDVTYPSHDQEWESVLSDVYYGTPTNGNELKSFNNKLIKARKLSTPGSASMQVIDNIRAVIEPLLQPSETFLLTKTTCQKGRKPIASSDRKTPERTLENTGTCAWCGKNVKLEGSGLHNHGYEVKWQSFQGGCPGQKYAPLEVSADGLFALNTLLTDALETRSADRATTPEFLCARNNNVKVYPGDLSWSRLLESRNANLDSDIRMLTRDLKIASDMIANWKPQPLPGDRIK